MATATRTNGKPAAKIEATAAERVIALIAGESGTGKSLWVASLKNALIIDTDLGGGLAAYDARIARNGSERHEMGSYLDVIDLIGRKRRAGELKRFTTLAIDHLTALQQEAVLRHNPSMVKDFGTSGDKAAKEWRKIRELVRVGDFNLVCTAHLKGKWADEKIVGVTTDASKNVEADMMIVLYLQKHADGSMPTAGRPSVARVSKWRRDPDDTRGPVPREFPFTMDEFIRIHGWPMEGERVEVPMASEEQVKELKGLLDVVKVPEETTTAWLKKAKVESFEDMTAETIGKCIDHLREKAKAVAGATTPGSL
jgi:ABC-type dipeptide/oligopeptide/nickel transport system ATPase component